MATSTGLSARRVSMRRLSVAAILTAGVGLAAGGVLTPDDAAAQQDPRVQRGRQFAETNCAKCHAVGRFGESPLRIAPPFRTFHLNYPVDELAESLAEGIVTGHPTMPEFRLDGAQIGDLIAYLKTLEK